MTLARQLFQISEILEQIFFFMHTSLSANWISPPMPSELAVRSATISAWQQRCCYKLSTDFVTKEVLQRGVLKI